VARINVTPVKGTTLLHPERVELTPSGIPQNRRFFLIDEAGGLFSAPDLGALVRIVSAYDPDAELLTLTFPDGAVVRARADALDEGLTVDFYGRPVEADVVQGPFSDAISTYADRPLRVVRSRRQGDGSDVHHLSLMSTASVTALAAGADLERLDPRRFRMDLELDGCEPYEEDSWDGHRVRIGGAVVRIAGQVPRCVLTTKDPDTGEKDFNTLREIARQRPRIPGDGGLPFGMYAEVEEPGPVTVGDEVVPEDP
jgi:uncharacterized protein YcbX